MPSKATHDQEQPIVEPQPKAEKQPSSPYMPRQIQSAPRQYKSKKSNMGLKVLVIVLAVIAVMAIGFAVWALLSTPANSAPKELQADGFTATNEKDFFKIVWKADKDTPRGIVQIVFVQNTFPKKTIFKYDSTKVKGVEVESQISYHGTKRSILLLKLDDPENFDSDYQSHSASLVKGTSI